MGKDGLPPLFGFRWYSSWLYGRFNGGLMPRRTFQDFCCQCPWPCGETLLTHACTGDTPTLAGSFGSVSCGVTAPFLWVFVHTRFCLCPSRLESHFPQSCGSPIIKSHRTSKSDSLEIPSPLSDPQAGKPDMGFRMFTTVGELLWYYCSPVCGSPSWWVWDLILLWLHPSCHLVAASSLSLDVGHLSLVGSRFLLLIVV